MQDLYKAVMEGWSQRWKVRNFTSKFWNFCDEISYADGILFKGESIIIPQSMRKIIMNRIHYAHLGIEKCKARARGCVFWPGINSDIAKTVSNCTTCLRYQRNNRKQPLIPHKVPSRPWAVVGADIFYFDGKDYLLVVDYYSKYPEVDKLVDKTSSSVIRSMKNIFARHGIPEKLVADNMPFNSKNFHQFCRNWEINLVTSSPRYPRSNGLAERNVQTMKNLLKKAKFSNQDFFLAVLEFRNTPITGMNESPAELLMSRKLRSRIPTGNNSLQPRISADIKKSLYRRQQDQKRFYDRATLPRKAIKLNDSIRFREGKEWHPAVVVSKHDAPRSFNILTPDGRTLRRNQYHLVTTKEQYPPYVGTDICPEVHKPPSDSKTAEVSPSQLHTSHDEAIKIEQPQIRRSTRIRRPPERYCDQY
uniref:uncharacterized protein K02A2.6-like isoform X1 n=1 Tax=Styela clava TaxID=7725 RepID=UPI00193A1BAB|nr:uncharacterized protein K02A2.6-like isoform X1 [Styela clava]XP_039255976.1 uncharacterized protein K02A2.6-like isoform X1 [Styela clava]